MDGFMNFVVFWLITMGAVVILNLTLFHFAFIRRLGIAAASVGLIIFGQTLEYACKGEVPHLLGDNPSGATLYICLVCLIAAVLLSFDDSLLDFECIDEFEVSAFSVLGIWFVDVNDEKTETPAFFGYYIGSTITAILLHIIFVSWLGYINFYWIVGIVILAYSFAVKPIIIFLGNAFY